MHSAEHCNDQGGLTGLMTCCNLPLIIIPGGGGLIPLPIGGPIPCIIPSIMGIEMCYSCLLYLIIGLQLIDNKYAYAIISHNCINGLHM